MWGALKLSGSTWLLSVYWAASWFDGPARGHGEAALRGAMGGGGGALPPAPTALAQLGPRAWGSVGPSGVPAHSLPAH